MLTVEYEVSVGAGTVFNTALSIGLMICELSGAFRALTPLNAFRLSRENKGRTSRIEERRAMVPAIDPTEIDVAVAVVEPLVVDRLRVLVGDFACEVEEGCDVEALVGDRGGMSCGVLQTAGGRKRVIA